MSNRLRQGGLKIQHSIIRGLKKVLVKVLAEPSPISRIIPGEIRVVSGNGFGTEVLVHVTVPLLSGAKQNGGFKIIAQVQGATQDLFVSTKDSSITRDMVEAKFAAAGANLREQKSIEIDKLDNDSYPVIGKHH